MKRIEELRNAIENGSQESALKLCEELYNDLRDFSQCIDVVETNDKIDIRMNTWANGARTKDLKRKIQDWVGGH